MAIEPHYQQLLDEAVIAGHGQIPWWAKLLIELLHPKPLDFSGLAREIDQLKTLVQATTPDDTTKENAMSDQDILNTFVADLGTATTALAAEIQGLKDQIANGVPAAALDFTGANAALASLQGLEPAPAPAPVDVPPVA